MNQLLRLDASARHEGSISRQLGDRLEAALTRSYPALRITRRDLAREPVEHIRNLTIQGYYTPTEQLTETLREATALSDRLIAELRNADAVLLTTPMYNFSAPSVLKAWIDQIMRIGQTFSYQDGQFDGLLKNRTAYIVCALGAPGYGDAMAAYDHLTGYLKLVFQFIGFSDVQIFAAEGTTLPADDAARLRAPVERAIDSVARPPHALTA
jgi:FMN-dependent NADH-azoreductase